MDRKRLAAFQHEEDELRLFDLLKLFWGNRYLILSVTVLFILVTAVSTWLQKPMYRTGALIQARSIATMPIRGVNPNNAVSWSDQSRYLDSQLEVIRSRKVLKKALENGVDGGKHPLLEEEPFKEISKNGGDAVGLLQSMLIVDVLGETNIIRISVQGPYQEKVAHWANAVAIAYRDNNVEQATEFLAKANAQMLQQVKVLSQEYQRQTDQVYGKLRSTGEDYIPENQTEVLNERNRQMELQLNAIQVEQAELGAFLDQVKRVKKSGGSLLSLDKVGKDEIVRTLTLQYNQYEQDLNKLLVRFTPEYPEVKKLRAQLNRVSGRRSSQVNTIIQTARNRYSTLTSQAEQLQTDLRVIRGKALDSSSLNSATQVQASSLEALKKYIDLLYDKMKEVDLSGQLMTNNIALVEEARTPGFAIYPRPMLNLMLATMAGIMAGLGLVFLISYLDVTIKNPEEIEQKLHMNFLAMVPKFTPDTQRGVKEAFQTLRTSLVFASRNKQNNLILFTSASPKEGKTSTAVNLGTILASTGDKVCVLDCDLRRPSVHKLLRLPNREGLTKFLAEGDADLGEFIQKGNNPNMDVLVSGPIPPNPPELFNMRRFQDLLLRLKKEYDWVLIDSPPAATITDAIILADLVDLVTIVVRFGKTDRKLVQRVLITMEQVNTPIAGAILNNVDVKSSYYYDYYYSHYYYYGGGERSKSETKGIADRLGLTKIKRRGRRKKTKVDKDPVKK